MVADRPTCHCSIDAAFGRFQGVIGELRMRRNLTCNSSSQKGEPRRHDALAERVAFRMICHVMAGFDQTRSEAERTRLLAVHLRGLRIVLGETLFSAALDQSHE